jgi:hypothetical protein
LCGGKEGAEYYYYDCEGRRTEDGAVREDERRREREKGVMGLGW